MLNYEAERSALVGLVPRGTELDEWRGRHPAHPRGLHPSRGPHRPEPVGRRCLRLRLAPGRHPVHCVDRQRPFLSSSTVRRCADVSRHRGPRRALWLRWAYSSSVRRQRMLDLEGWRTIVTEGRIIRPEEGDELDLLLGDFESCSGVGLPEYQAPRTNPPSPTAPATRIGRLIGCPSGVTADRARRRRRNSAAARRRTAERPSRRTSASASRRFSSGSSKSTCTGFMWIDYHGGWRAAAPAHRA